MKVWKGHLPARFEYDGKTAEQIHTTVAEMATKLLNAFDQRHTGLPQRMNSSHFSWTIDANNDWWLLFDENRPMVFEFRHRYMTNDNETARRALTEWFAYRIGAVVTQEEIR